MPGQHSIFRENAFSVAASASMSSALPSVEPIFARSRDLKAKTCHSALCMRVLVAALASVAAITVLVFLCSRAQERLAMEGLQNRRLASPEGRDAGVDICGDPSGGEEPNQRKSPKRPNVVAPVESKLPIKKRLLARLVDAGTGDYGPTRQQQEQQEQEIRHEPAGAPFDFVRIRRALTPGELGLQPLPHRSGQASEQQRTPTELDAATGLLTLTPHQPDAQQSVAGTEETASLDPMRLQQEVYRQQGDRRRNKKKKLQVEQQQQVQDELHHQQLLYWQHLQFQQLLSTAQAQQQYLPFQQQEQKEQDLQKQQQHSQNVLQQQLPPQYWPQQQQQQYWFQQQGHPQHPQSQQHYGVQRGDQYTPLLHQQQPNYIPEQKEQHSAQEECKQQHMQLQEHGEQVERQQRQVTAAEELVQEQEQMRQRQGHQGLQEEGEARQLQPADAVSVQLEEDEWIFQVSPELEEPEPSGSQEASQTYASATAAGPPANGLLSGPVVGGFTRHADAFSGAASGVSRDKIAAVPGIGAAGAEAAGKPDGQPTADPFSATSATAGRGMRLSAPLLASLLTSRRGAGQALAAAAPAAGSPLMAAVTAPAPQGLSGPRTSIFAAITEHPFVRLPKRVEETTWWGPIRVDFKQALSSTSALKNPIPLLHKARALLLKGVLSRQEMRELGQVAETLIEHAMHYQNQTVDGFRGSYAVERLGIRFMVLDVVVSTLIVLDQTPEPEDWHTFVNRISHSVPPLAERRSRAGRPNLSAMRALELSRAIQTLKRGVRPEPKDLLRIKRMLLCLPTSPRNFQTAEFNAWRQEDCNFSKVSFFL